MIGFFKALFSRVAPKTYKIIHDPKLGYVPALFDGVAGSWWAIDANGEESQSVDAIAAPRWARLWCETQEEAGRRINLHATSRGRKTVWSA